MLRHGVPRLHECDSNSFAGLQARHDRLVSPHFPDTLMFGGPTPSGGKLSIWLDQFQQSEPATQRGALVHLNLLEDGNVSEPHQRALYEHVESQPPVSTPEEAARLYDRFLCELGSRGPVCTQPNNAKNRIGGVPFARLSRVVGGDAFMKYNFYATNKRKVPQRHRSTRAVQTKVRLEQIRKKGVQFDRLRGNIGGAVVFASGVEILERHKRNEIEADGVRNRLGLDDVGRFGRDGFMVGYVYDAGRAPGGEFFRPTVLDAGWADVSAAFLPSEEGSARPGRTQDLSTGDRAEPEVLHRSFPANEVEACQILGPLADDPPDAYKSVRLAPSKT
jgi:hypothetical protein